jgi:prepilin-type N-terminal cleavage/methylation domain-containing protein
MGPKMTSPTSSKSAASNPSAAGPRRRPGGRGAFTLIEMLIVIGILVLLIAFLTPVVFRAQRRAKQVRIARDLQTIEMALDAYKADFGDFPRVAYDPGITNPANPSASYDPRSGNDANRPNPPSGAEILCRALIAPAAAVESIASAPGQMQIQDGSDGPGFRVRGTQGRVYGPYLQPDKFKIRNIAVPPLPEPPDVNVNVYRWVILDSEENPILYFPRRAAAPPGMYLYAIQSFAAPQTQNLPIIYPTAPAGYGYNEQFSYDVYDNVLYFQRTGETPSDISLAAKRMYVLLNDYNPDLPTANTNFNGKLDPANGETQPAIAQPYLLWSAGLDGKFGTDLPSLANPSTGPSREDVRKCDDVTNFTQQ